MHSDRKKRRSFLALLFTASDLRRYGAIIVTSSYLTGGAIERVERDSYILGKVDRKDLTEWIRNYNP